MDTHTGQISESNVAPVPYIVHEGTMARMERTVRRLWIAVLLAVILLFASNSAWLWAWMQFDYINTESNVDVNARYGVANYIGEDGGITNGTDTSTEEDQNGEAAQWQDAGH